MLRAQKRRILGVGVGIGVAIGIGMRNSVEPMNLRIEINSEPIAIPTPIPTPRVASIRPAVRGRPKPRLLGVVDYSPWCWIGFSWPAG